MLRNILGPVFNLYLDQFFNLLNVFCFLFFFVFWGAETPMFIVFSTKMQNLKKHEKEKKTLFVNTIVLTALVKMSVFLHFSFLLFFQFPFFQRCFLIGFPKSKNSKKTKQAKQKKEQKEDKRCKAKTNEILCFKTKQDNKQNNRNQGTT